MFGFSPSQNRAVVPSELFMWLKVSHACGSRSVKISILTIWNRLETYNWKVNNTQFNQFFIHFQSSMFFLNIINFKCHLKCLPLMQNLPKNKQQSPYPQEHTHAHDPEWKTASLHECTAVKSTLHTLQCAQHTQSFSFILSRAFEYMKLSFALCPNTENKFSIALQQHCMVPL